MSTATLGAVSAAVILLVAACVAPVPPSGSPSPGPTATPIESTALPTVAPTASPSPIAAAPAEILPVDGTALPIAARDGAPGLISCGAIGPFAFQELFGPGGAEMLVGPEYDVLRQTIAQYGKPDNPEFESLGRATFTVVYRDGMEVGFLGKVGRPEGIYASVTASLDSTGWRWAGMDGGCIPVGAPGKGWSDALWDIDPAFNEPTAKTQKLHLLVREIYCAADVPIAGRLSPAWVFLEQDRVRIHVFVRPVEPSGSCEGIDPTPVTIMLPEPLGPRVLVDDVNHDICYGCGG